MANSNEEQDATSVKVYQQLLPEGGPLRAKFRISLPDQPGSLAGFASTIAQSSGNIAFFHYDRSLDAARVAVEVALPDRTSVEALLNALKERQYRVELPGRAEEVMVTDLENVLEIKVRLENRPGTLAAFARLLAAHDANVIYMLYDEDIDAQSADIAMSTATPREIDRLLHAVNEQGYHYRVVYRGGDEQAAANVIGLKMVEKFFLRLKKLLPSSDITELRSLVDSSRDLQQDLIRFATEAGKHLEAGDVFEKVLTFASQSRARTGEKFHALPMRPLRFHDCVDLFGFRLPTSENVYVFRFQDELVMIDAGHGIYYGDIKRLLEQRGMAPGRVRRIYVTHPDTDHAGTAGYFEREFGTQVFLHGDTRDVIASSNRAHNVSGPLLNLNKYYTRLSTRFTECRFPSSPIFFPPARSGANPFSLLDTFSIGPLTFEVLESLGGHTPGLVFFLNRAFGLLFTSDFLLNVKSLTSEDKEHLGLYRYLLTNPNRDSRIYREETAALTAMMLSLDEELQAGQGITAMIFPGHGEYYPAAELRNKEKLRE